MTVDKLMNLLVHYPGEAEVLWVHPTGGVLLEVKGVDSVSESSGHEIGILYIEEQTSILP
jgi:hypothetical protein